MERKLLFLFISITSIVFIFSHDSKIIEKYYPLINNYNPLEQSIIDIKLDTFVDNNINRNNSTIYYSVNILNDTEQIFFDYQSEYGCLYINVNNKSNNNDFIFCSEGKNDIFTLNKSE